MARHKNVVHISEITSEALKTPDGSPFGALRQQVGSVVGADKLGYSFFTVPPGKAAFPFHLHNRNEEMIYIVDGNGTLRLGKDEVPVSSGTFITCPPGPDLPHQLINTSQSDLRYFAVSTMEYPEIAEYPDSNEASTGLHPWVPSFLRRNPPKHPPSLFELRRVRHAHSSTGLLPESSAKADKIGAYVTSASSGEAKGFRALYIKKDTGVAYEGEDGSELERVKKAPA